MPVQEQVRSPVAVPVSEGRRVSRRGGKGHRVRGQIGRGSSSLPRESSRRQADARRAFRDRRQAAAAGAAVGGEAVVVVREHVVANQRLNGVRVDVVGPHVGQAIHRSRHRRTALKQAGELGVGASLVDEGNTRVRSGHSAASVQRVFDQRWLEGRVAAVLPVRDAHVVADGVADLVQGPHTRFATVLRLDARIGRVAVLEYSSGLAPDLEIRRATAGCAVRDDSRELIDLGAVLGAVCTVHAIHCNESLAIEAKPIAAVVVDAVDGAAVLRRRHLAARDGRKSADAPADAHDSVTGARRVDKSQIRLHTCGPRGDRDWNRVGRVPLQADADAARGGPRRIARRIRRGRQQRINDDRRGAGPTAASDLTASL